LTPPAPAAFSPAELARLRADTPAFGRYAHFAHGSASLPPQPVFDAMQRWFDSERRDGALRAQAALFDGLEQARPAAARLLGAQPHQIAFVDAASRAWALAFGAACDGMRRVEVISSEHEYGANAVNLLHARERGRIAALHVLADAGDASEETPAQALRRLLATLDPAALAIVSLPVVAMAEGRLLDLEGVADAVHAHNGLLFLDASHAAGQTPLDMRALGCDVLLFPARKWLRGPKGISVLCLSERALGTLGAPPTLDTASAQWTTDNTGQPHADARRFELYEHAPALRLGLAAACDYAMNVGIERIAARNRIVRDALRERLAQDFGLQPLYAGARGAFLTYPVAERHAEALLQALTDGGVNANLITPQYTRWALERRGVAQLLRLTPHYLTSEEEVERLVAALRGNEGWLREGA
jgi:selenocysteine lyase/cysteine desulfurase